MNAIVIRIRRFLTSRNQPAYPCLRQALGLPKQLSAL
jgi:hypothetical protein